ncbi:MULTISPECIES: DUF1419 domain-containing protein [unclassified Mesorhizobium]|uniref:DUF1419 domain-containing protein n=1 Tax=unclassified Mesorhizobium TaxID=325217 RepID=UPI001128D734|nr:MULTISPECIES: DUF1419 domain-containing protein [unclassified Mesorhizobium]MBZ9985204.1 DUF1419 domain-containing protein [Mesorhizobium sp. BR-1-1-8]TPL26850.1 DUF1419 domain-containing protein [Mesorhizobium sp. B2-4-8]TPL58100.1 DUF1419 domain-containing protein [Mesorhizobium sp. B2-4-1]
MSQFSPIRKVYQGIADRRQMFRMFDRHAQRSNRFEDANGSLYSGEWFELAQPEHAYMFNILPPLFIKGEMFAMREFLTGSITSVFFTLKIDDRMRFFHAYCDLADKGSPANMRAAIVERESRPVRAMTREERIEHIYSSQAASPSPLPSLCRCSVRGRRCSRFPLLRFARSSIAARRMPPSTADSAIPTTA